MNRFLSGVICCTLAGLLYVYTEVEAVKIGYTIQKQEDAKIGLVDRARALKYNIARFRAPNNLERRLAAQRIILQSPKQWQTLVMPGRVGAGRVAILKPLVEAPQVAKFFIGTARAEAKETAVR
jgi:hypothetical protein